MKNTFSKFHSNKISAKEAQNVLGGLGGSYSDDSTCRRLEEQQAAAAARGDFEEAMRIMRIIIRVCGVPGSF